MSVGRSEIVGPMPQCGRPGPSRVLTDATHFPARQHGRAPHRSSRLTSCPELSAAAVSLLDTADDGHAAVSAVGKGFVKHGNDAGQEASAEGRS